MGSTNKTSHYELPQFVANDKPSWLGDVNEAMEAIDTGIYGAKSSADGAQQTANNAVAGVQSAGTRMDGIQTQLDTVATQANQTATTVTGHTSSIATNSANINTLNSRLGSTDISAIGDGTVTGAISAISGGGGGSVGYHVVATGTGSTITAILDSLYSAIDGLTEEQKVGAKIVSYDADTGKITSVFSLFGIDGGYQFSSIVPTTTSPYSFTNMFIVKQSGSKYYSGSTTGALVDSSTASIPANRSYKLMVL